MLFSVDLALGHVVDGRIYVLDAKDLKLLGLIGTGNLGMVHVPHGTSDIYVATTHLSRTTRGTRTDVVEIYSGEDLTFKEEIPISSNRAQALELPVAVLDLERSQVSVHPERHAGNLGVSASTAGEEADRRNPEPRLLRHLPLGKTPLRFATTCGDGTFGTIDVTTDGSAEMKASRPIFDADADALFSSADRWGDKWVFASYGGNIYIVDVEGDTATLTDKICGFAKASRAIGGRAATSRSPSTTRHRHGLSADAFERRGRQPQEPGRGNLGRRSQAKKVVGRARLGAGIALTVSQGDTPALFAIDGLKAEIVRYDLPAAGQPSRSPPPRPPPAAICPTR